MQKTVEALNSFRGFSAEDRRLLLAGMIHDFIVSDGRDETIRLLLENVFGPRTSMMERQAETLAAFAILPKDAAAALLGPFDPTTVRVEDCLSDVEVDRLVSGV